MSYIFAILVFILDIWAIIQIIQSGAEPAVKLLWVVIILLLPVVGVLLWFFLGPGRR